MKPPPQLKGKLDGTAIRIRRGRDDSIRTCSSQLMTWRFVGEGGIGNPPSPSPLLTY